MMKQFREREKEKKVETAQTSMFGKLIGSGVEVANEKLLKDIEILQEELKIKIEENECIHMKQWELQQEHEQSVASMKKDLKSYQLKIRDLEKQATSKNKCIFELGEEKERHRKRRLEIEEKFEEMQSHLADREAALKEINEQLKNDLHIATSRLEDKVVFDDCREISWSSLDLPPHNEDLRKKRKRASERSLALLGQICNNIDEYSNARGALIRLQLHHPKFLANQGSKSESVGSENVGFGASIESSKDTIQENIISQLTTYALSWRTLQETLSKFFQEDYGADNVGSRSGPIEDNDYSNRVVIIMKQLKSVVSWHESLVSSEIDLIEADGRTDQMEGFADTLKALQKSLQQFYQVLQDAFLLPGDTTSGDEIESKSIVPNPSMILPRKTISCLAQIVRCLRAHATAEATVLQEERQQPFVPQAVRAACMEVEKNIFQVSSVAERFVECSRDLWKLYFQSPSTKDSRYIRSKEVKGEEESKMTKHLQKTSTYTEDA